MDEDVAKELRELRKTLKYAIITYVLFWFFIVVGLYLIHYYFHIP